MADQAKKKPGAKRKARDEFDSDDVFKAPVITRDPVSRQAKLGGKVVLRVTAEGKPLPSYQWFHNGKKISGANTDRLTLNKLRRQSAGAYHCEAKNFVGKVTSRVAMLSFFTQRVPKLVIGPELIEIEEGKPFKLKVISPTGDELKDLKIFWLFNGLRIKGAHGPELGISAAKKKYEGEYKAIVATGGSLETSNIAKMILKAAKAKPAEPKQEIPAAPEGLELKLSIEPKVEEAPALAPAPPPESSPAPAAAANWNDFLFNPEDEESEEASVAAPAPESDMPLSQLPTRDLIREIASQGGASALLESAQQEDPSALILSAPITAEDPSSLIEALEKREEPIEAKVEAIAEAKVEATTEAEDADNLVQDWGIPPAKRPFAESYTSAASIKPKLLRKKELLEKLLGRFQAQNGKKAA